MEIKVKEETTAKERFWRNTSGILTGLLILAVGIIAWQLHESGNKDGTYSQSMKLAEEAFQVKMKARDTRILALENDLKLKVDLYDSVQGGLKTQIKRLKSRTVQLASVSMLSNTNQDSVCIDQIVIRDSVIVAQDTLISSLEYENLEILTRGAVIVGELKSKNALLDSANTAKLGYMVKQSDIIESQDKKISKLQRLSKILGISTATLSLILALIVAL